MGELPRAQAAAEQRLEYRPEFGRPIRILEFDRPMMSDEIETAQTITYMDDLATADAGDRAVIAATAEALEEAGCGPMSAPLDKANAIFWWLKKHLRYVPTEGTSPLVDQTLITPAAILAMPDRIGDCPQFSMLAAAMFRVCCVPCYFVTIAAEPSMPDEFSHVYNAVDVGTLQLYPFDASNGPAPGSEFAFPFKKKIWPRIHADRCAANQGRKTRAMMRNSRQRTMRGMRSRSLYRSLGDVVCDADDNCYDTDTGENISGQLTLAQVQSTAAPGSCAFGTDTDGNCLAAPAAGLQLSPTAIPATTPAASAAANPLTALFTSLGTAASSIGTQLAKAATTQTPYFITAPNGQSVLYNPNTGAVGGTTSALLGSTGSISPIVLLLGVGAIALFAFSGKH